MWFERMYELAPIDTWDKSLKLKKVFGMYATDIRNEIEHRVYRYSKEYPHTVRCGLIGDPNSNRFEPIVYAKIDNNGTVFAFTNGRLEKEQLVNESLYTQTYEIPF